MAQPGDRQEILGKLSIPCVALLLLYSPNCVEGEFSGVHRRILSTAAGLSCSRAPRITRGADCLGEVVHARSQDVTFLLPGFNTLYVLIAYTPTRASSH